MCFSHLGIQGKRPPKTTKQSTQLALFNLSVAPVKFHLFNDAGCLFSGSRGKHFREG